MWYFPLFCLLPALYLAVMANYVLGWRKVAQFVTVAETPPRTSVTVVVAARNEHTHIDACVQHILANQFPANLLEIIVVDDGSEPPLQLTTTDPRVRLLRLPAQQSGKKAAVTVGVTAAQNELIACTDADCQVPPHWLHLLTAAYERTGAKALCAPVAFHREGNLLQRFQSLDFAGLMGITAVGIAQGWQRMGNGANLAYPKKVFEEVGGFSGNEHRASGDDLFLLQKIAARWPGRDTVFFVKNAAGTVLTECPADWAGFWRQRLRWGTKNAALPEWRVKAVLAVVFLFCWQIVLTLAFAPLLAVGLFLLKAACDWALLRPMCRFFGRDDLLRSFLPAFLLHTGYIAVVGVASLFQRQYQWKGRRLQ